MIWNIFKKLINSWKSIITFAPEFKNLLDSETRILTITGNLIRSLLFGISTATVFIAIYSNITPLMRNVESILAIIISFIASSLCADSDVISWIHKHYGSIIILDCIIMAIANSFVIINPNIRIIIVATVNAALFKLWMVGYNSMFNNKLSNDDLTKWNLISSNASELGALLGILVFFILEFCNIHISIAMACIIQVIAIIIDGVCDNIVHRHLCKEK